MNRAHHITKLALVGIATICCVTTGLAQRKTLKLGIELQGYPTGFIPGLRVDLFFSDYAKVHLRAGYNLVRHGDAGEHDDERGGGPGVSVGYDVLPFTSHRWMVGIRSDLWLNKVDWYDLSTGNIKVTGTTHVTVLQPTAQAGYRIPIHEGLEIWPTLSFGYEINVDTRGAAVGHGPIILIGAVLNTEL